jgi:NADH-quinone oxidoreductase subunit C
MQFELRKVAAASAFAELEKLKAEGYNVLIDLTAIDRGGAARFEVIYRLMKLDLNTGADLGRVEVRCEVSEGEPVLRSVMSLWPIADWLEREVWDMFGVGFTDRPDIKRLLLYENFVGHPLRKDYPIGKRQPLIGPATGEPVGNPSFNELKPTVSYE